MRRFFLYQRISTGIYYVEFIDEQTGKRIAYRSTGQKKKREAELIAADWTVNGLPDKAGKRRSWSDSLSAWELIQAAKMAALTREDSAKIVTALAERGLIAPEVGKRKGPGSEPFCAWLRSFWDYDSSPYVAEREAHGQRITRRHCQDMLGRIKTIEAVLGAEMTLAEVNRGHLNALGLELRKSGRAAATVTKTMSVATTALRWAAANDQIQIDPTHRLRGFSGEQRRRGILTTEEVLKLFSVDWPDERAQVACMVAMTSGMRIGEILALQRQDIGTARLYVRHSYSGKDRLKAPKNGEAREAILMAPVREALLALEQQSPHPAGLNRFVFAGRYPDRPLDANRILAGFRRALVIAQDVAWEDAEKRIAVLRNYAERGIDFHSWRHFNAKHLADRVDPRIAQLGTGHKTLAMIEHYANHAQEEDMNKLEAAVIDAFGEFFPGSHNQQATA